MKIRCAMISAALLLCSLAFGQTDNTLYVKRFPGLDVGAKIAAAQSACNINTAIQCIIVIDPSLAVYPQGTNPAKCVQCVWEDYRSAAPVFGLPGRLNVTNNIMTVDPATGAVVSDTQAFMATVYAGPFHNPSLGVSGPPTFRALTMTDLPGQAQIAASTAVPLWLQYLGDRSDGSVSNASGVLNGEKNYVNFTLPYGNTVTTTGLVVHATGTCNLFGSIVAQITNTALTTGIAGGGGGGGGGGAAAGTVGANTSISDFTMLNSGLGGVGGSAGALSGGTGGAGAAFVATLQRLMIATGGGLDGNYFAGASGGVGGSSGGAKGYGGAGVIFICGTIVGNDTIHTGVIDASGTYGMPPAANSQGAGGGGGGGVVLLSSRAAVSPWPTVYVAPGAGAVPGVPLGLGYGGSCTSPPKAMLSVSGGPLSASCAVQQAGANCGTGAGVGWAIVGGGGTAGTAVINPTWAGGAMVSCTVTPGTSSGFTAATYTTSGSGGDGGPGWFAEYQGW